MTEYLSKFPYAVPIKSKSAEEIGRELWEYISIFGPPKQIISEQGKEFINETINSMCLALKIDRAITSAYHPQTNGLTERFNATLVSCLRKVAAENPKDWDEWLPWVLMAYRARKQSTTELQPYELVFGKKMNWLSEYISTSVDNDVETDVIRRAARIREHLIKIRKDTRRNIKQQQDSLRITRENITKHRNWTPVIGEWVYKKNDKPEHKLSWRNDGPWELVGKTKIRYFYLTNKVNIMWHESVPIDKLTRKEFERPKETEKDVKPGSGFLREGEKMYVNLLK